MSSQSSPPARECYLDHAISLVKVVKEVNLPGFGATFALCLGILECIQVGVPPCRLNGPPHADESLEIKRRTRTLPRARAPCRYTPL
jgi:hypothetical protein